MFLVPTTPYGENQWNKVFEVTSLNEWADARNIRMEETGISHRYWVVTPARVEYCDGGGKLIMKYIACEKDPFRLLEIPS